VSQHDREQWEKLSALPNLIYTDGQVWALYRNGVRIGPVVELEGDLHHAGEHLRYAGSDFEVLLKKFFAWRPARPDSLRKLVADIAPLCRLLRDQVAETMIFERSHGRKRPLVMLASEWRGILFPNLSDDEFADAYAQTVTFSLLLARLDGISFEAGRSLTAIAEQLSKQHSLMGEALAILTHPRWAQHLSIVEMLRHVIGNVDWAEVRLDDSNAYTLLYETFLAEYEPRLRRESGTYYTPDLVARAMVTFVDQVLKTRMHKPHGLAARDVVVVDPAMGAGTFLVEIVESVVATLRAERGANFVPQGHLRELFAERLVGFEVQAAPYAVAELRLHHLLKNRYGVEVPRNEVRFLSDALDDPDALPLDFGQLYGVLKEAREGANRIKRQQPVMVVIGNPPWRERARGAAPWIEKRRKPGHQIADLRSRPSLDEFREPGQERRTFNLSNMWTYFWRWSTWKVFDTHAEDRPGVVILITPKAYVTSESHAGMRRYLRETADEGWIIDVSPEDFRPDGPTRLFPGVQQPICIGIFARYQAGNRKRPAKVHYLAVHGTRDQKITQLLEVTPDGPTWVEVPAGWTAPLRPGAHAGWDAYPKLSDLFHWKQTGVNSNRNWVWAPDPHTLRRRWARVIHASGDYKAVLFKESDARILDGVYPPVPGVPSSHVPLREETAEEPRIVRAAFRSFDRQYLIYDRRVIDRPRAELWHTQANNQVYISEQHAHKFGAGPGLIFSALVPGVDHFNGRGGRVLPLYEDPAAELSNLVPGLLECLARLVGMTVTPEDLLAYVAAVAAHPAYTRRFSEELQVPGIRVPLSLDIELWREAVTLGREVVWVHTYGESFVDPAAGRPHGIPLLSEPDRPKVVSAISVDTEQMPSKISYDEATKTVLIGEDTLLGPAGRIAPVDTRVWNYTVGGVRVVDHWFGYRQRSARRKKRTSPLDDDNPLRWIAEFDDDLFALLNVLGRCVALELPQTDLLDRVISGPLITVENLHEEGVFPPAKPRRRRPASVSISPLPDL
jgi:hypothetical protein